MVSEFQDGTDPVACLCVTLTCEAVYCLEPSQPDSVDVFCVFLTGFVKVMDLGYDYADVSTAALSSLELMLRVPGCCIIPSDVRCQQAARGNRDVLADPSSMPVL